MKKKIIFAGLLSILISGPVFADQCANNHQNFTGAGLLGGDRIGKLLCIYTDGEKQLPGMYQIVADHWRKTEFGWACGGMIKKISPDVCQFKRIN